MFRGRRLLGKEKLYCFVGTGVLSIIKSNKPKIKTNSAHGQHSPARSFCCTTPAASAWMHVCSGGAAAHYEQRYSLIPLSERNKSGIRPESDCGL